MVAPELSGVKRALPSDINQHMDCSTLSRMPPPGIFSQPEQSPMDSTPFVHTDPTLSEGNGSLSPHSPNLSNTSYSPPFSPTVSPWGLYEPVTFSWTIPEFSEIMEETIYSEPFEGAGRLWRLVVFPRGNDSTRDMYVSIFIELHRNLPQESQSPNQECSITLKLLNSLDESKSRVSEVFHVYSVSGDDYGLPRFFPLDDLLDPSQGYLPNDCMTITTKLEFSKPSPQTIQVPLTRYTSRDNTGFVGIKNQGATCYMNSILQTMYHLPILRKLVYLIRLPSDDYTSVSFALQSLFYELEHSPDCVSTRALTTSFGWNDVDAFLQHDVQEFCRVLIDNLEEKMKGTELEKHISEIYQGKFRVFIECINVDYTSTKDDSFYDLSLNVKGCDNVYDSFRQYTEEEMLDGDNQYRAESHGLQDAKKYVRFISLPPVLQLQLKRFEYDPQTNMMVKLNNYYEFPAELDLSEYVRSSDDSDNEYIYSLHSVLVHSGSVYGGHYYAYIRSGNGWYKYDDEMVTRVEASEAMDGNYGVKDTDRIGLGGVKPTYRSGNAYMLVYTLKGQQNEILSPSSVSEETQNALKCKIEEMKRIEMERIRAIEDEQRKTEISFFTESMFSEACGIELEFDANALTSLKVYREDDFHSLDEWVYDKYDISPSTELEFYAFTRRQNGTIRPNRYYSKDTTFELARKNPDVLVRQKPTGEEPFQNDSMLILFKYYDSMEQNLSYAGSRVFSKSTRVSEVMDAFRSMTDLSEDQPLLAWEEECVGTLRINPLEHLDMTLEDYKLMCGDIIVVQIPPEEDDESATDAYQYLEFLRNQIVIHFYPADPEFPLSHGNVLSSHSTDSDSSQSDSPERVRKFLRIHASRDSGVMAIKQSLAQALDCSWANVLIYSHDVKGEMGKSPWEDESSTLDSQFRIPYPKHILSLYFDTVDRSEEDIATHCIIPIWWCADDSQNIAKPVQLSVPRSGSTQDILSALKRQPKLDIPRDRDINLVLIRDGKARPVSSGALVKDLLKPLEHSCIRAGFHDAPLMHLFGPEEHEDEEPEPVWVHWTLNPKYFRSTGSPFLLRVHSGATLGDFRQYLKDRFEQYSPGWKILVVGDMSLRRMDDNSEEFTQIVWGKKKSLAIYKGSADRTPLFPGNGSIKIYN